MYNNNDNNSNVNEDFVPLESVIDTHTHKKTEDRSETLHFA